jgi:hypothetical protein
MRDETEMDETLLALRDLGLPEPRHEQVDARVRAVLDREIRREQRSSGRRFARRRLPLRVALPVAALLMGSLGAVAYATLSNPERLSAGIECHDNGKLDGGGAIVGVDGRAATDTCAALWASGTMDPGATAAPAPLHACVDPKGGNAIHVFASADSGVCERVGLKESPQAGADPRAQRYARFEQAAVAKLSAIECPTGAQARRIVQNSLDSAGLAADWTIREEGGSYGPDSACASLAIDSDARVATIAPVPVSR